MTAGGASSSSLSHTRKTVSDFCQNFNLFLKNCEINYFETVLSLIQTVLCIRGRILVVLSFTSQRASIKKDKSYYSKKNETSETNLCLYDVKISYVDDIISSFLF